MSRNHQRISVRSKARSMFSSGAGRYQRRRRSPTRRAAWLTDRVELLEDRMLLASDWIAQGPGPAQGGQIENVSPNNEVVGAIHTVAAHPTNADILYIGGTNGGVSKTTNATAASPTWTPLTDDLPSLSIGALEFDPTDGSSQTLVAGVGRYSSFFSQGGSRVGLLRTTDGGSNWTVVDGSGTLIGKNISGVAPRGSTITVSVNTDDNFACANQGVFRSTDGGVTFGQRLAGVSYDLASHPGNANILYSSLVYGDVCAPGGGQPNGVYRSVDQGASWTKVSDPALDALIIDNATSNLEMSVGNSGEVYAAVINTGVLAGMFRSPTGNLGTWVQMDSPQTNENGADVGLNPGGPKGPPAGSPMADIAGGQGAKHFSIRSDPNNANIVYVGGDRQPHANEGIGGNPAFPNSIGAFDYSGRLFRCDAIQPAGSQCVHLTHSSTLGAAGGGTASSSAPHADSREMVFDANGNIIEVDDGGIYRRTSPQDNTGDWFSIIGSLQVTEAHGVAYDPISDILFSGNQDTGSTEQISTGSATWRSVSVADGGDVAVDSITLAGSNQSIRYSSYQDLGGFRRRIVDNNNNVISTSFPNLTVTGGGPAFEPQFVTPIALNAIDPQRIIFGGSNGLFESTNQGDTIAQVAAGVLATSPTSNPIAYGGRSGGVDNLHVVYAGDYFGGIHVRTASGGAFTSTDPDGASSDLIRDVHMDPNEWHTAFAIDANQVFTTTTTGALWTDITGDLAGSTMLSLEYLEGTVDVVAVGTSRGVFVSPVTSLGTWVQLGNGLPNVPVWDMDYDATDDVLAVGTLGRGVWTLSSPTSDDNNDDFADRLDLGSGIVVSTTGNNVGYTGETGEPSPTSTTQSAWWSWTAPGNGTLRVDTFGSDFDTFLSVYTGLAVDSLTLTPNGSNDDSDGTTQSAVGITVSAGTEYEIAVDGYGSNTGNITLNLAFELTIDTDPDDQISEAPFVSVGSTANGDIDVVDDVDLIAFSVSDNQRVRFDLDTPSVALDSILRLFDQSGTPLAASDDDAGPAPEYSIRESFIDYTFGTGGIYYIGVSGYDNSAYDPLTGTGDGGGSSIGSYELTLLGNLAGDFDGDGNLNGVDIDLLIANIAIGPADPGTFDLTGDSNVNLADRDEWLVLAGAANIPSGNAYLLGDANLDQVVDVSDFNIWNTNKFTGQAAWTKGDFTADGFVDVSDFNTWNTNKFRSADSLASLPDGTRHMRLDSVSTSTNPIVLPSAGDGAGLAVATIPSLSERDAAFSSRELLRTPFSSIYGLSSSGEDDALEAKHGKEFQLFDQLFAELV